MSRFWTPTELQTIFRNYTAMTDRELSVILPGRSPMAIAMKRSELCLRRLNRHEPGRRYAEFPKDYKPTRMTYIVPDDLRLAVSIQRTLMGTYAGKRHV